MYPKHELNSLLSYNSNRLINRVMLKFNVDYDEIINMLIDVSYIIINHIHQNKVPKELESTMYNMVLDYYKSLLKSEEKETKIKSTQRGDVKIEFNTETKPKEFVEIELVNKYSTILNQFRKMRW